MSRYSKRVFTAGAIFTGCGFSLIIGFMLGAALSLVTQSLALGLLGGVVGFGFSVDMIFRGTE